MRYALRSMYVGYGEMKRKKIIYVSFGEEVVVELLVRSDQDHGRRWKGQRRLPFQCERNDKSWKPHLPFLDLDQGVDLVLERVQVEEGLQEDRRCMDYRSNPASSESCRRRQDLEVLE